MLCCKTQLTLKHIAKYSLWTNYFFFKNTVVKHFILSAVAHKCEVNMICAYIVQK